MASSPDSYLATVAATAQAVLEARARLDPVRVVAEPPESLRVVFGYQGRLYGWRYRAVHDPDSFDAVRGAVDVIDANVEEFIDTDQLKNATAPDADGIAWLS